MGTPHWRRLSDCGFDCEVHHCILGVMRRGCVKMVVVWSTQNGGCEEGLAWDSHERVGKDWLECDALGQKLQCACALLTSPSWQKQMNAQFAPLSPFFYPNLRKQHKKIWQLDVSSVLLLHHLQTSSVSANKSTKGKYLCLFLCRGDWEHRGPPRLKWQPSVLAGTGQNPPALPGTLVLGAWTRIQFAHWAQSFFFTSLFTISSVLSSSE